MTAVRRMTLVTVKCINEGLSVDTDKHSHNEHLYTYKHNLNYTISHEKTYKNLQKHQKMKMKM